MNTFLDNISRVEKDIYNKIIEDKRISDEEALYLFKDASPVFCGYLANYIKEKKYGKNVFYNKNIHVELSNICVNKCKFCSFYRDAESLESWNKSVEEALQDIQKKKAHKLTEIHLTGALNPKLNLAYYKILFSDIKKLYPAIHIKALTAIEVDYLSLIEKMSVKDVLIELKACGLESLAGGGAEILDEKIRNIICKEKTDANKWLSIHKTAHKIGIYSNATMLYGHIEKFSDRITHLRKIRNLQDTTKGFNCFIPLKYKSYGNSLGLNKEIDINEQLKTYAVSRIYLDNIEHIKAYWPMCGKNTAFLSLNFGVDDIDGTVNDTTKIYSMAGSEEQNPQLSENELIERLNNMGLIAVERDSLYKAIK